MIGTKLDFKYGYGNVITWSICRDNVDETLTFGKRGKHNYFGKNCETG